MRSQLLLLAALVVGACVAGASETNLRHGLGKAAGVRFVLAPTPETMRVHYIDVGQADAALRECVRRTAMATGTATPSYRSPN